MSGRNDELREAVAREIARAAWETEDLDGEAERYVEETWFDYRDGADAILAIPALANAEERARVAEAELRSKDPAYTPLLDKYVSDIQVANDQVEALTRRVAELEVALRPFARLCRDIDKQYAEYPNYCALFWSMTHGDLRRAAALLDHRTDATEETGREALRDGG